MRVRVELWVDPGARPRPQAIPARGAAVIVDVLRATTTLTVARANGAGMVRVAATPAEAFALRSAHPSALLCGEREGRKIEGFDLGNSPYEYAAKVVSGRDLIFASTNGSLALRAAARARVRILAAFANLTAVVERLRDEREIVILCAGKQGRFALEDAACAGSICERLEAGGARLEGAEARCARALAPIEASATRAIVQGCAHGRYLRSLGPEFVRDVELCGRLDVLDRAFEV